MVHRQLEIEELVDLSSPTEVKIAPQGSHVIYTLKPGCKKGENSTSAIWIAEVGKENSARQLTSGLFEDRGAQWSTDGRTVAFISDRAKAGKSNAVYLISLDGGEPFPITPTENERNISGIAYSPCGSFIAYRSADEKSEEKKKRDANKDDVKVYGEEWNFARLRLLHVSTKEVETVVKGDIHVQAFAWRPDSKVICYLTNRTPDANSAYHHGVRFHLLDLVSRQTRFIVSFPGTVSTPIVWADDDKLNFLAGYDPDSACTSSTLYQLGIERSQWDRVQYGESNDARGLCSVIDGGGRHNTVMRKVQNGLQDRLEIDEAVVFEDYASIQGFSAIYRDKKFTLGLITSQPGQPLEIFSASWVRHGSSKRLKDLLKLSNHRSSIASTESCVGELFECKSKSDGLDLSAVFLKPSSLTRSGAAPPSIVLIHGGPYSRSTLAFDPAFYKWAPYLASVGYGVLCPNYRGGSGFGNEYASAARGGMNTKDFTDVRDIVEAAIKGGLIHPEKIVVGGWSQGGFLSYLSAVSTFPFKGAICGAGVTDWDMLTMTSDLTKFEAELAGRSPWATEKGAEDVSGRRGSPIWLMQQTKNSDRTPVLILHGEEDKRVPWSQASAFHRACLDLDWPCEFVTYPRQGHFIAERNHQIDMMKRVRRFCDLHLG